MCGIAGFAGRGDREVLQGMTDAIRYRGPDAEGHWADVARSLFLGHRRLSIVDLSGGAQPMWTHDQAHGVVFNGEIYNHAELRTELKSRGCHFQTDHSDTEVLLHAYREWGESFVSRLNGMWAFVIYDRERQRLFGSRDRFGKKPLYYFHEQDTFAFASELPALRKHPQCPRNISLLSLKKYFAHCYIPAPRSIYEGVWKLPGGWSFFFDLSSRELRTWPFWKFVLESDDTTISERKIGDWCESIRETLERAVKRRLMSDVPLGVFLSGGIDSSAIAALAAKHVPSGELNTFSVGFNEASFDESKYAELVAQRLNTKHHEEILDLEKSADLLPEIVSRLDEPLGDSSLLPTYLLSRFTRKKVTVALGGDGGDELFAGYDPFRALHVAEHYSRFVPRPVHDAVRLLVERLPVSHRNLSFDFKAKRTLMGLSYDRRVWNPVWMAALSPNEIDALFGDHTSIEELYSESIEAWDACQQPNLVDQTLQWWTNLYLQDDILAKVDRASMLCSLEARSPFLDIEFVDLVRRIPWQLKLRNGKTKWILKKALAPILPAEIVHRKKKGFGMPVGRWLRESRFQMPPIDTALFDESFVRKKMAAHQSNRSDERLFLWSLWIFSQWKQHAA